MIAVLENSVARSRELAGFWNLCLHNPFRMDERLMREYLAFAGALVITAGEPWKGVLWGRLGELGVTLDAVMVLPAYRRCGVGRALVESFSGRFAPQGGWRFGGGSRHFVPGLPQQLSSAHGFFSALGCLPDWEAHDLLWERPSSNVDLAWDETVYRLITESQTEELERLLLHFGRRWQTDTGARCRNLERGCPEEIMGAYHRGELVGFCHIWSARSQNLGPSTFWLSRGDSDWGGIGPLGVHPNCRGLGLGAGVVESSMAYLRGQGAQRIGVDWTGLPAFYERCGFQRWLSYRGYRPAE